MQMDNTGVNGADPAENETPSYIAEVEENKVNPLVIFMLYFIISCVCLEQGAACSSLVPLRWLPVAWVYNGGDVPRLLIQPTLLLCTRSSVLK